MTEDAYVDKVFFLRRVIRVEGSDIVTDNYATGNGNGLALNVAPKGPVVNQKWKAKRVAGEDTVTIIHLVNGLGWTYTGPEEVITLSASPSKWIISSWDTPNHVFIATPPPNQHQRWSVAVRDANMNASLAIRVDNFVPLPHPPALWVFETIIKL